MLFNSITSIRIVVVVEIVIIVAVVVKTGSILTSPLSSFDIQELASMSGHCVPLNQGSDGADIPQSLVEGKQLGGKVQRSETATGAPQPALLFIRQRRDWGPQQCVRLHGGAEEWVGILEDADKM